MTAVVRRFGQVIRIRPEAVERYEALHAEPWPAVNAAIRAANIRDYSIYRYGEWLFASFEYVGEDYEGDMARMAADPYVQRWWALTDAMQEPLPEREPGSWWLTMLEIFRLD
jgi:L-rhamnose mutarotase